MISTARRAALGLAALLMTGCAGLNTIRSVATPVDLYSLTPKSTFDPSLPKIEHQIVVVEPLATAAIATDRIMVHPTPLRVQFLPGARWVDRAPVIVQTLLVESYENSGRVPAVGRSEVGLRADYVIVTDMREFQVEVEGGDGEDGAETFQVHVRLNLKLVETRLDRIIASQSFAEVEPAASSDTVAIVLAFDEALGDAMRDAVEWSIRSIRDHGDAQAARRSDVYRR